MNLFHNPDTCPICLSIRQFETNAAYTYAPATRCMWGVPGCNCWNEALDSLGADYEVLTLDLTDLFEGEYLGDEAESELSRVIGEVRAGNILLPDEGDTLVQALVEEEQAHAETLADLGDAEDRIAELEAELADVRSRAFAALDNEHFQWEMKRDEALALAAELELKNQLLELASRSLELAANALERMNQQARATILAGNLYAAIYI